MDASGDMSQNKIYLFGILALAYLLRITAVHFGLPELYHADEPIVVNHALAYGSGDFNPHFFKIPPLVSYLLFMVYGVYFVLGKLTGSFSGLDAFEQLFYSDPTSFYLIARIIFGVLLGTLTVFFLFRLVCRMGTDTGEKSETVPDAFPAKALLSAFLLAVCFLHVRDSHYVYTDIPLLLVMVLTFIAMLDFPKKGASWKCNLLIGALIGLATAIKYNGIALVIPYLFFTLFLGSRKKMIAGWIVAGFGTLAVFLLLNPYAILDFQFFKQEILNESNAHRGAVDFIFHLKYSLPGALGWPLLLVCLLGMIRSFIDWDVKKGSLFVFIVAYYGIISIWGQPYPRYVLPLLPFLIYFAADFVLAVMIRVSRYRGLRMSTSVLLLALPTLAQSVMFDWVMFNQDTRSQSKGWIEENIPSNESIALDLDFYMPRLLMSQDQLEVKKKILPIRNQFSGGKERKLNYLISETKGARPSYELYSLSGMETGEGGPFLLSKPILPYDVNALKARGVEYVVAVKLHEHDLRQDFYDELETQAELMAEFNPYRNASRTWPHMHPLTGGPFLFRDILERERNGQPLKIYKL